MKRPARGFSLVELMVGLAIGLVIAGAATVVYVNASSRSADTVRMARLNQDLRALMHLMTSELRRAGYAGLKPNVDYDGSGGFSVSDLACNPFQNEVTKLQLFQPGTSVPTAAGVTFTGSCALYSYNTDEASDNGVAAAPCSGSNCWGPAVGCGSCGASPGSTLPSFDSGAPAGAAGCSKTQYPVVNSLSGSVSLRDAHVYDSDNFEMFGFRLKNNAVEMRTAIGGANSCNDGDGTWSPVTNSSVVQITKLAFTLDEIIVDYSASTPTGAIGAIATVSGACPYQHECQFIRTMKIELVGNAADDSTVQASVTDEVRVRNDRYVNCQLAGGCT